MSGITPTVAADVPACQRAHGAVRCADFTPTRGAVERDDDYLNLLARQGFENPEAWVEFARREGFREVPAAALAACPGCGERLSSPLGQFVHFSNALRLRECAACGLVFADRRVDPAVIQSHFESAYKDEEYFARKRRPVFDQISALCAELAPHGGTVLDVGGAKGHLLDAIRRRRPDLRLILNDVSETACAYGRARFGLEVLPGTLSAIARRAPPVDVLVMSDVLYYEPDIRGAWDAVSRVCRPGGALIIRVPNKLPVIRVAQRVLRPRGRGVESQSRIRFFNPEHLYVLSRGYLERRLRCIGFASVDVAPAALLAATPLRRVLGRAVRAFARVVQRLSRGALLPCPAIVLIARDFLAELPPM